MGVETEREERTESVAAAEEKEDVARTMVDGIVVEVGEVQYRRRDDTEEEGGYK